MACSSLRAGTPKTPAVVERLVTGLAVSFPVSVDTKRLDRTATAPAGGCLISSARMAACIRMGAVREIRVNET